MAERLEADLGVKVQEVRFPELRYGFQIWSTYMGLSDKEGNVGPPVNPIVGNSYSTDQVNVSSALSAVEWR